MRWRVTSEIIIIILYNLNIIIIFVQDIYKIIPAFLWKFKCKILGNTYLKDRQSLNTKESWRKKAYQILKSII